MSWTTPQTYREDVVTDSTGRSKISFVGFKTSPPWDEATHDRIIPKWFRRMLGGPIGGSNSRCGTWDYHSLHPAMCAHRSLPDTDSAGARPAPSEF